MELSLADDLTFAILTGIIVLAHALGKSVADGDPKTSYKVAVFWVFLSGMWFIGPVTFFAFPRNRPLLARRCLQ